LHLPAQAEGIMGWIDINELIRELLAIKANNEELTKRVLRLELEVEAIASRERDRFSVRYVQGDELW
jgi:hypothetical protein